MTNSASSSKKNIWSPQLGYPPVRDLLARTRDFTAIFCFNDTAAIGAVRAIEDAGLNCPRDISVIGFDDIIIAEYFNPRLTTVRQPLHKMGTEAARLLVHRIQTPDQPYPQEVWFEPQLIVRESTMASSPYLPGGREASVNRSALEPAHSDTSSTAPPPRSPRARSSCLPLFSCRRHRHRHARPDSARPHPALAHPGRTGRHTLHRQLCRSVLRSLVRHPQSPRQRSLRLRHHRRRMRCHGWVGFVSRTSPSSAVGLGLGAGLTAGNIIAGTTVPAARARLIAMLNVAWGLGAIACPVLVRLLPVASSVSSLRPRLFLPSPRSSPSQFPVSHHTRRRTPDDPESQPLKIKDRVYLCLRLPS